MQDSSETKGGKTPDAADPGVETGPAGAGEPVVEPAGAGDVCGGEDAIRRMTGDRVVIDTDGPIVYLGTLRAVTAGTLVLTDADAHDCREGHAGKELYLIDACRHGVTVNRRQVVVMRSVVMSISRLTDIVTDRP